MERKDMKKKLLMAALALTLAFAGCGNSNNAEVTDTEIVVNTEAAADTENVVNTEETSETTEIVIETEVIESTEEVEETEVVETTEEPESTEIAEETETAEPEYTVTDMDSIKYAKSSVNVRKGPSADYEKVGSLTMNQEVKVTGQASTGWYRIELNGEVAFVSNNYLVDEKVVVAQTTPAPSENNGGTEPTPTPSGNNGGSTPEPTPTPSTGIEPIDPTPTPEPTPEPTPTPETENTPKMITVYVDVYTYFLAEDDSGAWVESYGGECSTVALEGTMVDPRSVCMAITDPNVWTEGTLFEAREGVRGILRVYYNYKESEY